MKKYLVLTNIWGKKEITMWLSKDVFKEEKEYFDTLEEAKEYAQLFADYSSTYKTPQRVKGDEWKWYDKSNKNKTKLKYNHFNPGERLWGYVIGDTEECKVISWGGICMYNISKDMDQRRVKDYLFRGEDEIPKNYVWDEGEYEGWLQFRWGDRKNALDYVEPEKPKKKKVEEEPVEEEFDDSYIDENEDIENSFMKDEDKEKLRRLMDRW